MKYSDDKRRELIKKIFWDYEIDDTIGGLCIVLCFMRRVKQHSSCITLLCPTLL